MTEHKNGDVPDWLIPDKLYGFLKWAGLLALPAAACLVATVGPVWDWDNVDGIVTTLNGIGAFVGVVIGASALYNKTGGGNG